MRTLLLLGWLCAAAVLGRPQQTRYESQSEADVLTGDPFSSFTSSEEDLQVSETINKFQRARPQRHRMRGHWVYHAPHGGWGSGGGHGSWGGGHGGWGGGQGHGGWHGGHGGSHGGHGGWRWTRRPGYVIVVHRPYGWSGAAHQGQQWGDAEYQQGQGSEGVYQQGHGSEGTYQQDWGMQEQYGSQSTEYAE